MKWSKTFNSSFAVGTLLLLTSFGCCSTGSGNLRPPAGKPLPLTVGSEGWTLPNSEDGEATLPFRDLRAILEYSDQMRAYAEAWEAQYGR